MIFNLSNRPPFTDKDPMKTYTLILQGIDKVDFPSYMSRSAVMLIKRLCRDVPTERLGYQRSGINDIKKHRYIPFINYFIFTRYMIMDNFLDGSKVSIGMA